MVKFLLKKLVPVPKLEDYESFLFIGPHPDDIEIASGATVSKLVSMNKKVYFVIVTDGGSGAQDPKTDINELVALRQKELEESAAYLGVKDVFTLGYPDGGAYTAEEAALALAKIILDTNPDVLIGPDPMQPSEIHPDHIKTGLAMNQASIISSFPLMAKRNNIDVTEDMYPHFRARTLAYYYTHRANKVVKVSKEDVKKRRESVLFHLSQFPKVEDFAPIDQYLKIRGFSFRLNTRAEGFFILSPIHQHCFPEINDYN